MKPTLMNYMNDLAITEKKVINIKQGPQFQTKGGTVFAMIFLFFAILTIFSLVQAEFTFFIFSLTIAILLLYLILDLRGIEVDTKAHKIRDYKYFIGFKFGKWYNINEFKSIYLKQKNVTVKNSENFEYSANTYHYYHIKLVDEINNKEIFLAEYRNYYKAQKISQNIADATGLDFKDFLKGARRGNK
jgi:hypothetical protein